MTTVSVSNSAMQGVCLFKNLHSIRDQFCDVKIKIGEVVIPAHKCILCASCPFFKDLFSSTVFAKPNASEVSLTTLNSGRASAIIEYFYSGILCFNGDELIEMYKDVDFLQIFELKAKLYRLIVQTLDIGNCCAFWELFGDATDSQPVIRFICENIDQLLTDKKLLSFVIEKFRSLLKDVHEFETLPEQDSIYRMIMAWASSKFVIRGEELPKLLTVCNLTYFSEELIKELSDEVISRDGDVFRRKWLLENPFFHCVTSDKNRIFSIQGNGLVRVYYPESNSVILATRSKSKGEFATGIVIYGKVLYVAGGINSYKESSENCDPSDIGSENWSLFRLPFKFSRPQICFCRGEIYIFYANQSSSGNLVQFQISNSMTAYRNNYSVPSEGPDRIICTDGNFIYAIISSKESRKTAIYRDNVPSKFTWSELSSGGITYQNINHFPSTVNIFNNEIFLFSYKTGMLQSYSLKTNSWDQLKNQEHLKDPSTRLISTENQLFAVTLESVYRFTDGNFEFVRSLM